MTTYKQYQEQIAKLQILAEQAREEEITEARRKIQDLMQKNNLSAADLAGPTKKPATSNKKTGSSVQAKYRDPASGQTWTGRGRAPRWLGGKDKAEFLIK